MRKTKKTLVILMIFTLISNIFLVNSIFASGVYNTDTNRETYGSNYYGTSNIREWLNSSEYDVQYTQNEPTAANVFGNSYDGEKGFLADGNFTPAERNMLAPRTHKVLLAEIDSNVKEGGTEQHGYTNTNITAAVSNYDSSYYKEFTDRVFLPSIEQINNWVVNRGWTYLAKPTSQAVSNSEYSSSSFNVANNWRYWLNNPNASQSNTLRYVHSGGSVYNNNANTHHIGVRPALNLKSEISKSSENGTTSSPAYLGTGGEPLEIGDYVKYGKYYNSDILWRVIEKDEQGTVLFAEYIVTLKPFDAKGDGTYPELAEEYGETTPIPSEVSDIHTEVGYDWIQLTWNNPTSELLDKITIYQEGVIVDQLSTSTNAYLIEGLTSNTEYEIKLTTSLEGGQESDGISFTVTTKEQVEEVQNLFSSVSFDYIYLTWDNPDLEDLQKVIIYQDGIKVGEVIVPENEFFVEELSPGTEYEIRLTTKYGTGTESEGISIKLTTLEIPYDSIKVRNLKAETKHDRVNLSWQNPDITAFDFVRIYRKEELQEPTETVLSEFLFGTRAYAETEYGPIFETNGTKFNDLTVTEDTTYEYMLNSVTTTDEEVEGITIQATTTEGPPPTMGGVSDTVDENGDYLFSWSSPTTGQVKVFVGGTEYATVEASLGQVLIPEADMQYTMFNNPDVQLQPISESGTEGKLTTISGFGSIASVFTAGDLLTTSMQLMMLFGPFILLGLAIYFVPRLMALFKKSTATKQQSRSPRS